MSSSKESRTTATLGTPVEPQFAALGELVERFERGAERSAVIAFRGNLRETISYRELAELVQQTARGLLERGLGRGERIALLGPNTPEWIVAYLGIVTAGAVAVPLDPQSSTDGTVAAVLRAAPKALVTTRAQRTVLEPLLHRDVSFWLLDGSGNDGMAALRSASHVALPRVAADDTAALLFTSGTTGTPKAVALTHGNLMANLSELLAARLIDREDRVLVPLPLHHTYPFTVGLLTPLATGATVVIPAGISGPEILDACASARATALVAVPRLCAALWEGLEAGVRARGVLAAATFRALLAVSIASRRFTRLRFGRLLFRSIHSRFGGALDVIGCGGAKLPAELAWQLEGLGFRVLTGYGLTETSPVLTFNSPRASLPGSEGRPLPGVEVRIAGPTAAVPGEILARGPSVFRGYWNDAEATAAAFTTDGWFRTGDLGRIDEHGFLHVIGRSKELIVLADGKKFFPSLVEKAYAESSLLKEIGVFERDGLLAAVVVPNEDAVRARGSLREAAAVREQLEDIAARLPPYQRITNYRIVRTPLPRTQLGKLRRHLLPALYDGGEDRRQAPSVLTEADRALLATRPAGDVWQWLVQRYPEHQLSLDTSPQLDLAIDSLAWVALTVDLEQRFEVTLLAEQLARILTLRDLLREVAAAPRAAAAQGSRPIVAKPGALVRALGAALLVAVRLLVRLLLRPCVRGADQLPAGPALIAPNHTSYLDPLVIAAALPWRRLRRTYWAGWVGVMHKSALRRLVSRATQVIAVDPDRDLAGAVRTAHELLEQGYDVVWFPEGRRSPTGQLQEFQAGVGLLLQGTAAAVVPTGITGTFAAWPKHRRWPRLARVGVSFGKPLTFAAANEPAVIVGLLERSVGELLSSPVAERDERGKTKETVA